MLFYGKSDIGKIREKNEDNFITLELCENLILCVICDGVGGHEGGDIASELAIITFSDYVSEHLIPFIKSGMFDYKAMISAGYNIDDILTKAVYAANTTICQRGKYDRKLKDMGTTLVAALIVDKTVYIANVGDCRLYTVNKNIVSQITHDHSLVQNLIDTGKITPAEAAKSPLRHVISKVVGAEWFAETDTDIYKIEFDSEYILMCSDGLFDYTDPSKYGDFLNDINDITALQSAVEKLVNFANDKGGRDNVTVILIKGFDNYAEPAQK